MSQTVHLSTTKVFSYIVFGTTDGQNMVTQGVDIFSSHDVMTCSIVVDNNRETNTVLFTFVCIKKRWFSHFSL